jgi:hypothetical protein
MVLSPESFRGRPPLAEGGLYPRQRAGVCLSWRCGRGSGEPRCHQLAGLADHRLGVLRGAGVRAALRALSWTVGDGMLVLRRHRHPAQRHPSRVADPAHNHLQQAGHGEVLPRDLIRGVAEDKSGSCDWRTNRSTPDPEGMIVPDMHATALASVRAGGPSAPGRGKLARARGTSPNVFLRHPLMHEGRVGRVMLPALTSADSDGEVLRGASVAGGPLTVCVLPVPRCDPRLGETEGFPV